VVSALKINGIAISWANLFIAFFSSIFRLQGRMKFGCRICWYRAYARQHMYSQALVIVTEKNGRIIVMILTGPFASTLCASVPIGFISPTL
jgi:hypothetical protein